MAKETEQKEIEADEDDNDVIVVKEIITIEDGKHQGHIGNMVRELRHDFDYIDLYINLDDVEGTIKAGFPCNVSERSTFGKLLTSAGIDFVPNQELSLKDIKKQLVGRDIEFSTFTENDFARVINKTIVFI